VVSRSAPAFASSFLLLTLYKSAAALSILLRVLTAASAFWSLPCAANKPWVMGPFAPDRAPNTPEWGSPRIRKNVESGRGWHRQRLNVISRQPALSFSASGVPAGLAMKNRATERRFRGRRRLPEGAEIQKRYKNAAG